MEWLAVLGILVFFVGLMLSIALHEVGHLVPAKAFGIKTTQYMVGFGRTVWSRRRGETEYGVKAVPLGGYVRMIGMFPPEPGGDPHRLRRASTGPFQALVDDARRAVKEEIGPADEGRLFYEQPWWKKLVVMLGGPLMNVVIALVVAAAVLTGYGLLVPTATVSSVSRCIIPVDAPLVDGQPRACTPDDAEAPAAAAGFRPGDTVAVFDGTSVTSWTQLSELIRDAAGRTVNVVVERDGRQLTLTPTVVASQRYADPTMPDPDDLVRVGFLGVAPTQELQRQDLGAVVSWTATFVQRSVQAVLGVPQKMAGVWQAAFGGAERDPYGPVGIVGAGRIGGEIASADEASVGARVASFLMLVAGFNMAIAIFNLIPLLPLDGGHAAGAGWEGLKRGWARLTHRPMPAPVDVAKALPLAYGVATVLIGMSVLLLYADLVNPVRLPG